MGRPGLSRLVGSNVHYFYYPAETVMQQLADAGFSAMELYLGTPQVFVDGSTAHEFADLAGLAQAHGIRITAVHPETLSFRYTLCHPDPEWNRKSVAAYRSSLNYAAEHAIPRLNTNIAGSFRDIDPKGIFAQVLADLTAIGKQAAELGITVGLETESENYQGFISTLPQLQRLLAALDEAVPATFDVVLNADSLADAGETEAEWFSAFGRRISSVRFGTPEAFPALRQRCEAAGFAGDWIFYPLDDPSLLQPDVTNRALTQLVKAGDV